MDPSSAAPSPPAPLPARPRHARERGSVSVLAAFVALAIGGLATALLMEGLAAKQSLARTEDSLRALEGAETGLAKAEQEISSGVDAQSDGVGSMTGSVGSVAWSVTATKNPLLANRFTLTATGCSRLSTRRVEVGLRRWADGSFTEGLFSHDDLVFDGTNVTDAYDSRLGTYASQAVNSDAAGTYALTGGNVGSNAGFIELNGSSITVRGDAIPGPGRSVTEHGDPVVTGDTTARKYERDVAPTTYAEFAAALASNQDGTWTQDDGNLSWNSTTYALSMKAGGTLTLPGGTYFFSAFSLSGGSTVKFTGPSKVYVTGSLDLSGGTLLNTGVPSDLVINAHPYALPSGFAPTTTQVKLNGGSASRFALYGPDALLTIGGGGDIYGAAVVKRITINGNCRYHYDKALADIGITGAARVERLYWREPSPPRR